ncbi:MAG TPA: VOC family protein [Gemmatimonadales bacterium]|nr:VOC family protein [Gemmatimonadales bacterium]
MATRKRPKGAARKRKPKTGAKRPQRRQPESLRLSSMAVSLSCTDLDTSIAWYSNVLGFTVGERWEESGELRGIQMKAGACDIMLSQDDFAKGRDRAKGEGLRIWVATAQDVDRIAAHVRAKGGRLDYEPQEMPWGDRAFALTDPDGFKITFIQE